MTSDDLPHQVSLALQRASFEVRKAKRPDYYALLKVWPLMTSDDL